MTLARLQSSFLGGIAQSDEGDGALPAGVPPEGFAIYRNAYRTSMIETLSETFPRTLDYVGEDAFARASAHFILTAPPSSWSLDHFGAGFSDCLADLFKGHEEVTEIAALEWAMHLAFVHPDVVPLTAADIATATASFSDEDWQAMRLGFVPMIIFQCTHDLLRWWRTGSATPDRLPDSAHAIVWREEERPVFAVVEPREAQWLRAMQCGASFGDMCAGLTDQGAGEEAIAAAAQYLQHWVHAGMIASIE